MANIVVLHSRKGGVGKSTSAYELAYELDAVLVDFEHDGGGVSVKWGYRHQDRVKIPILDALETGRTPLPLKGRKKARLVPGHPDLYDQLTDAEQVANALEQWAGEWDTEWVVVDTHPGVSAAAHGAMQVAHAVVVPTPLKQLEINALEELVIDMADYPVIISPTMVPPTPPAGPLKRLNKLVEEYPALRVSPPVPNAAGVGTRTRRTAITSDAPPVKALRGVAEAYAETAKFIQTYVQEQQS